MGQKIQTGGSSSRPPAVKLQAKGDKMRFAVVGLDLDLPVYEYGTDRRAFTVNGKPKTQHALRVLVTDPGEAVRSLGDDAGYEAFEAGAEGTIYIAGHTKWDPDGDKGATHKSWGGALDELGGDLEVGTIGEYKFVDEVQGKGSQPKKMRRFRLRQAKPEEAELVARCEALAAAADAASASVAVEDDSDSEPF